MSDFETEKSMYRLNKLIHSLGIPDARAKTMENKLHVFLSRNQNQIQDYKREIKNLKAEIERKDEEIARLKDWLARASSHALKEIDNA